MYIFRFFFYLLACLKKMQFFIQPNRQRDGKFEPFQLLQEKFLPTAVLLYESMKSGHPILCYQSHRLTFPANCVHKTNGENEPERNNKLPKSRWNYVLVFIFGCSHEPRLNAFFFRTTALNAHLCHC